MVNIKIMTLFADIMRPSKSRSPTHRLRRALPKCLLPLGVFVLAHTVAGQIIPASNQIDWTQSGITGGIPNRTTIATTISTSLANDSTDATSAIQSALNSCPSGQVVFLPAGKYRINGNITIPSNVVLRGAGPSSTILDAHGSGNGVITFGSSAAPTASNSVAITGGATKGSTSITVSSASGLSVGGLLTITELNDPSIPVTIVGSGGGCTWCDGGLGWNGTRVAGQTVQITSVSGNTIGITPLYMTYNLSPLATQVPTSCTNAGLENLQIYANNTGYGENVMLQGCLQCWVLNIESNYTDGDHLQLHFSYRCEVRHSYFHDGFLHTPGTYDTTVWIGDKSSGCLVVDNICYRQHVGIMFDWGPSGNVVAYNYVAGEFDANSTNALYPGINCGHGAHPMYNLIEGNICPQIYCDDIWGSASSNTLFRNWVVGTTYIQNPISGRGALTGTPWLACQANYAMNIDVNSTHLNSVGNIVGSPLLSALTKYNDGTTVVPCSGIVLETATRSYDSNSYCYAIGFSSLGDGGGASIDSLNGWNTMIIGGDYNYGDKTQRWVNATAQTIPNSLFLTSAPSWFGNLTFPAFNPASPSSASNTSIPAGYRFVNNGADPSGVSSTPSVPAAPTNLHVL
jgi:Pectate lyase superfamily protein